MRCGRKYDCGRRKNSITCGMCNELEEEAVENEKEFKSEGKEEKTANEFKTAITRTGSIKGRKIA